MPHETDELVPTRGCMIKRLKHWDDHEGWREFFDLYWKLIYGVALKSGLTPAESQDVVQETVISVSKNITNFQADPARGSFKAWLMKLTRWRIIDQARKRRPEDGARFHKSGQHPGDSSAATSTIGRIPD